MTINYVESGYWDDAYAEIDPAATPKYLNLPLVRTTQPQQAVGINWSNPLTKGLTLASLPSLAYDAVKGKLIPISGATQTVSKNLGKSFSGVNARIDYGQTRVIPGGSSTHTVIAAGVWKNTGRGAAFAQQYGTSPFPQTNLGYGTSGVAGTIEFFDYNSPSKLASVAKVGAADNKYHIVAGVRNGAVAETKLYIDGVDTLVTPTGVGGVVNSALQRVSVGNDGDYISADRTFNNPLDLVLVWGRALSPKEIKSLSDNPWQIFASQPRKLFVAAGGSLQSLLPLLVSDSNAFYSPAIAAGSVTLTPALATNTSAFYSPSVSQGGALQSLTPSLFANSNSFYVETVTKGTVSLTPLLVTNANAFYSPIVLAGGILAPSLSSNTSTFYSANVNAGAVSLTPLLLTNSSTFFVDTITSTITPTLFNNVGGFPNLTLASSYALKPALVVNTNTFYSNTTTSVRTVSPTLFVNASSILVATVQASNRLTPGLFVNSSNFYVAIGSVYFVKIAYKTLSIDKKLMTLSVNAKNDHLYANRDAQIISINKIA